MIKVSLLIYYFKLYYDSLSCPEYHGFKVTFLVCGSAN